MRTVFLLIAAVIIGPPLCGLAFGLFMYIYATIQFASLSASTTIQAQSTDGSGVNASSSWGKIENEEISASFPSKNQYFLSWVGDHRVDLWSGASTDATFVMISGCYMPSGENSSVFENAVVKLEDALLSDKNTYYKRSCLPSRSELKHQVYALTSGEGWQGRTITLESRYKRNVATLLIARDVYRQKLYYAALITAPPDAAETQTFIKSFAVKRLSDEKFRRKEFVDTGAAGGLR